jgi:DNA-binding beta-propeller fold protein YncE
VSFQQVAGTPFGVSVTPDGRYAFVDVVQGRVLVYRMTNSTPRLVRTITVPGQLLGSSLTRDGRLLMVADGRGAAVISVARAEDGGPHPLLGVLRPPRGTERATGAIETASSADGRYVFVSLEYGHPNGAVAVYDLGGDRHPHFGAGDWVTSITLGPAVVGSALSPDGRDLYVTSELAPGTRPTSAGLKGDGTISVIDVTRAERASPHAVVSTVPAGHQPVRVAVSPDASTVWVTARADNELLSFSVPRLLSDPATARLAATRVGTAPVGLAVFDGGNRILIADSDRFNTHGAHSSLTVVDADPAPAHRPAAVATVRAGGFPREIALDASDDTALVTNFGSDQVETVRLAPGR